MKQNKLIYLIIFSLVFLGFTNGVKAGCCYESSKDAAGNILYAYDGTVPSGECAKAFPNSTNAKEVADEATCLAKNGDYNEYNTHQCCNSTGATLSSTKSQCETTYNIGNGYRWRTVYECASLKTICCIDGKVSSEYTTEAKCNGYSASKPNLNVSWITVAACAGMNESSTRNDVRQFEQNPYTTIPTNPSTSNPSTSNPDGNSAGGDGTTAGSGATGTDSMTVGFDCNDPSVKSLYNLLRFAVPVILIILGSVDFLRATIAGKDDEIEKHKKRFINRLMLAGLIFMLLSIFQLTANVLQRAGVTDSKSWYYCWNKIEESE